MPPYRTSRGHLLLLSSAALLAACSSKDSTGPTPVKDVVPPTVSGVVSDVVGAPFRLPGYSLSPDTLWIGAAYGDNHAIAYIGLRIQIGSTVLVDSSDCRCLTGRRILTGFISSPELAGPIRVFAFVGDSAGHRTEIELYGSPFTAVARSSPTASTVAVPGLASMAYDEPGNRLILGTDQGIERFWLSSGTMGTLHKIPTAGLDESPTGDTILVGHAIRRAIVRFNNLQPLDTFPIPLDSTESLAGVKYAANGHALVLIGSWGYRRVVSVDLNTGLVAAHPELADNGRADAISLGRSADGMVVVAHWFGSQNAAQEYNLATDRFDPGVPIAQNAEPVAPPVSIDSSGGDVLIGNALFGSAMNPLAFGPYPFDARTSVMAPEGDVAYLYAMPSARYVRVRMTDRAAADWFAMPYYQALLPLPGGRLVAWSGDGFTILDFSAPAARPRTVGGAAAQVHWLKRLSETPDATR